MEFEDRDIRQNAAWVQELIQLGSRATPTTVITTAEGSQVVIGFDRPKLQALLHQD